MAFLKDFRKVNTVSNGNYTVNVNTDGALTIPNAISRSVSVPGSTYELVSDLFGAPGDYGRLDIKTHPTDANKIVATVSASWSANAIAGFAALTAGVTATASLEGGGGEPSHLITDVSYNAGVYTITFALADNGWSVSFGIPDQPISTFTFTTLTSTTTKSWEFTTAGNLKLPAGGTVVDSTGAPVVGYAGSQGYTGSAGAGYTGSAGLTGSTGAAGYAGSRGYNGSQGYAGSAGTNGYTGSAGTNGYTGSAGTNGYTGSAGTGYTGSAGTNGYTGSAGTGYTGSKGDTGLTGSTGAQGLVGYTGSAGSGGGGSGTLTNALSIGPGLANNGDLLYTLLPTTTETAWEMGHSVATNGTYTVVSAHLAPKILVYSNATGALQYVISGVSGFAMPGQGARAVAINNANYIVVSDTQYTGGGGRVQIFNMANWSAYSGTTVTITSATTTITNPDGTGVLASVAINDSYVIIGNPVATVSGQGYSGIVYLYSLTGTLKYKITNPSAYYTGATDEFGFSIAVAGNRLIIGAPFEGDTNLSGTSMVGKIYSFNISSFPTYTSSTITISSSNYTNYGQVIDNPESVAQSPEMGYRVATNGIYIAATAFNAKAIPNPNIPPKQYVGAVYIFSVDTGAYVTKIQSPMVAANNQAFGSDIAFSDGNLLIGESFEDVDYGAYVGAAYLYHSSDWKLKKIINNPNAVAGQGGRFNYGDDFGYSVAISGNYAVVGAPNENAVTSNYFDYNGGAAYIFNINRTFDGSSAMTISLSPSTVLPGLYGSTDGSTTIQVPQLQVDHYGRVVGASTAQFQTTSGVSSAFNTAYVDGSIAFEASGSDIINFKAGTNVTLSSGFDGAGHKTITINSTGSSSGGGSGGSGSAAGLFKMVHPDPGYTNSFTFSLPSSPGPVFMNTYLPGAMIQSIGPSLWNPAMSYPGSYTPGQMFVSTSPNGTQTASLDTATGPGGMLSMWVLNASDVGKYVFFNPPPPISGSSGQATLQNPIVFNGINWSSPGYAYGALYPQNADAATALQSFSPAPGVISYFNSTEMMLWFICPASVWTQGAYPSIGSFPSGNFNLYVNLFYFGI